MSFMHRKKCLFFLVSVLAVFHAPPHLHAQTTLTAAQQAQLQAQLQEVEAEEKVANDQLQAAQSQSASLSRDITILDAKIRAAQLDIKAKTLMIQTLGSDISVKQSHINDLEDHIAKGKETLAQLMRKTNEIDSYSLPEVVLSQTSVSSFFKDLDTFQSVQSGLQAAFDSLRADEASTTAEKDALTVRQNAEIDARYAIQQQQKNIQSDENQKKQLLAVSKGNEKSYSALVAQKASQAAEIRAALFALAGGSNPIPFGEAYQYSLAASQKTGVRPAFILAILTQESNLGKNVGTCYLGNQVTGDGVNVRTGQPVASVMNPSRDVPPFLTITTALGRDPMRTVVSCPQSIGWGGAMGPSQFIASTWIVMKDELTAALGFGSNRMPDPWNPSHAIMATALYLADRGAIAGSYTSERNAACKYYSGSSCSRSSLIASYGNSVMALADNIQRNQIDVLQGI